MKKKKGLLVVFAIASIVMSAASCGHVEISTSSLEEKPASSQPESSQFIESSSISSEQSSEHSSEESIVVSSEESSIVSSEGSSVVSSEQSSSSSEETSSSSVYTGPQVGDTVKKWTSTNDYNGLPMETPNNPEAGHGYRNVFKGFGHDDECSLSYDLKAGYDKKGYITSALPKTPYFKNKDAKNGYIISLYFYAIKNSNIASFQLQALSTNYADEIYGLPINVTSADEETWKRVTVSFDSVDDFKAFRLIYTVKDKTKEASFLIDDINITIGTPTVTDPRTPKEESLCKLYEDDFKIGTCLSGYSLNSSNIKKLTLQHFNSITAENEGKPEHVLDQAGCKRLMAEGNNAGVAIKTSSFKSVYDFAEANHIRVRHHTFVWHNQTPEWFFTTDYNEGSPLVSKEVMLARMENYIMVSLKSINDMYPGLVYAIDVANEAIDGGVVRKNKNKWYDTIGSDYVYYAMKFAHKWKGDFQDLYYNDYSYDFVSNNCSYALNTLLKKAISEKLVDGLGIQGHLMYFTNMDTIIKDAKMIKEKGLKCQITELDIGITENTADMYTKQTAAYKSLMDKILAAEKKGEIDINAIVWWGVSDNYSWRNDEWPLLFDSSYNKKDSYYAVYNAKANS